MSAITFLIIMLVVGHYGLNWWQMRDQRAAEVAALEAIGLHTRPILIRSQFIGDADVEDRFELVRGRVAIANNGFIYPEDVHLAIYNTRTNGSRAFVDFEMWVDMVEEQHRQRVYIWEQARQQQMAVKGSEKIGLTDKGRRTFNGQRAPRKEKFEIEF